MKFRNLFFLMRSHQLICLSTLQNNVMKKKNPKIDIVDRWLYAGFLLLSYLFTHRQGCVARLQWSVQMQQLLPSWVCVGMRLSGEPGRHTGAPVTGSLSPQLPAHT